MMEQGDGSEWTLIEMGLEILEDCAMKNLDGIQILKKGFKKFAKRCEEKEKMLRIMICNKSLL